VHFALSREKQLKNWERDWKIELVEKENLKWNDLSERLFLDPGSGPG